MARSTLYRSFYLAAALLLLSAAADAQIVFRRIPSGGITQAPTPVPPAQKAETRRSVDDNVIQVQPAPDRDQRAQKRRQDDDGNFRDQPRLPGGQRPRNDEPFILVTPDQITAAAGSKYAYGALVWDAGSAHPFAEVWKRVDDGADEFVLEKGKGNIGITLELGKKYTFILTDFGRTLDTVTIVPRRDPKTSPIGMPDRQGRDVEANMTTFISDVGTEANSREASIKFFAASNANPTVEIGTAPPKQSNGKWVFPEGKLVGSGNASPSGMKKVGTKINTFHKFGSQMPGFPELEQSTVYWYIITVQNPDFQTTGQFSTSATQVNVRVVFEKVRIIDDSDELSDGDIMFWGHVNHGLADQQEWTRMRESMGSGETYDLGKEITIKNAQNLFKISVSANDDDCSIGCDFANASTPDPIFGFYNNKNEYDGNGAWDEWDLSRFATHPGETYRHAFTLKSREGKAKLRFEVTGYWEITRKN